MGGVICDILCVLRKLNYAFLALSQVVFVDVAMLRLLVNEAVLPEKALFLSQDSDSIGVGITPLFLHTSSNIAQRICLVISCK